MNKVFSNKPIWIAGIVMGLIGLILVLTYWFYFRDSFIVKNSDDNIDAKLTITPTVSETATSIPSITQIIVTIPPKADMYNTADFINFPISKQQSIGEFAPNDLIILPSLYSTKTIRVSNLIKDDLIKLIDAAKTDGITLKVVSGYRSFGEQKVLFNNYVSNERKSNSSLSEAELEAKANTYSAKPGHSEHQLGTTVDISSSEVNYQLISDENAKYAKWLEENASKYNFTISFEKNNPEYIYEPWHLRWRG
jgi:D-alanyl-D-alanine carboxypeptidase